MYSTGYYVVEPWMSNTNPISPMTDEERKRAKEREDRNKPND